MTKADIDRIEALLAKMLPLSVHDGRDYAEVFFGDGATHSTQAMTMNLQDWRDLSKALPALIAAARENERLREALVTAMIPIEAILLSGADAAHCQSVRDALHDAVSTARASLSTAKQGASDAD